MITEITPSALLPTLSEALEDYKYYLNQIGYMEDRQGFAPRELMDCFRKSEDIYRSCLMRDTGSSDL
ncbi:hypothetical protein N9955_00630 [bacterium]|nr:hypothetical protein [bacterium]